MVNCHKGLSHIIDILCGETTPMEALSNRMWRGAFFSLSAFFTCTNNMLIKEESPIMKHGEITKSLARQNYLEQRLFDVIIRSHLYRVADIFNKAFHVKTRWIKTFDSRSDNI